MHPNGSKGLDEHKDPRVVVTNKNIKKLDINYA